MGLSNRVSAVSGIPQDCLDKFNDFVLLVHGDDIYKSGKNYKKAENESLYDGTYTVELFEGTVYIRVDDNDVSYKFIPNEEFNKIVLNTIKSGESPLTKAVSMKVVKAMSSIYRNLT